MQLDKGLSNYPGTLSNCYERYRFVSVSIYLTLRMLPRLMSKVYNDSLTVS